MNVPVQKVEIDSHQVVQDFMTKTAKDCAGVIDRNLSVMDTLGIVDGPVISAICQAAASPGASILVQSPLTPEFVAAQYVLVVCMEARKKVGKKSPDLEHVTAFMNEIEAALAEPLRKFIDL